MRRVSGGYTLIELLIVLTVTIVMIGVSLTFLSGREGQARFSGSVRDAQSKFQSWLDNVSNGVALGTTDSLHCSLNGAPPPSIHIDTGPPPTHDPECIFLGKAIQIGDETNPATANQIYAYTVFGRRISTATGFPVANMRQAEPVPAANSSDPVLGYTGSANLTEVYTLGPGATVKSVYQAKDTSDSNVHGIVAGTLSHLGGFYLSLNDTQTSGGNNESNLDAYLYPVGPGALNQDRDIGCIEQSATWCPLNFGDVNPQHPLRTWQICFASTYNHNTALLSISSNGGVGVSTQLKITAC
jgi:type II secretory pathway pseudopilin PulG